MKVLIAPDSFKESLTAVGAAEAMAQGARQSNESVVVDQCPIGDGGEGTVAALVAATDGETRTSPVHGPLGEKVEAKWGLIDAGGTAVIEMAEAAGLQLVPDDRRDPMRTTTYGVGELIVAALDAGVRRIILGIGGSATNDGGAGMAQALGVRFIDRAGEPCGCGLVGGGLTSVAAVDFDARDKRLDEVEVRVACDVDNPLTGKEGAARTYAPQKGASESQVEQLDEALAHLASVVERVDPRTPGAGAAGGLGFGLIAFAGAKLTSGIDLVLDAVDFDARVRDAELCLTGEGKLDGQSLRGKAIGGVVRAAAKRRVPVIAIAGTVDDAAERMLGEGLLAAMSICRGPMTLDTARENAAELIEAATANVMRVFLCGKAGGQR